ncbi:MAG: HesA/MoeB/ThiF family protein [Pseudomonadota bacterium]
MNDDQLSRYSRHLLLPEIDIAGQETLLRSRALVVGLGGLGSPIAMYLAASGVGTLVLCDHDRVELSNLQRQILHTTSDISRLKTASAYDTLAALNPEIKLIAPPRKLEGEELLYETTQADVVIDASDNFATRYALNAACIAARKPLVSGSALRTQGQVTVFRADKHSSPCYHCLYPDEGHHEENCAQSGVFAPLLGIIGSIQAAEALKILLGLNDSLWGRLLRVDARDMTFRSVRFQADPHCPVCAKTASLASEGLEAHGASG